MNFLFFRLRVLTHAKYVMPNTPLCPHGSLTPNPSCFSCNQTLLEQAEATPQLLTKACCTREQDQQITTRNGFKSLLLVQ